ncbi:hypothetical protein JHK82_047973 [Glycine max]|nr:hypothetical protein JHK86_047862 [Glycine max]KAG4943826.1 hypothetical protein JHK85_048472 [Glycine max]KAG5098119.1 hypothetical protein JHK82_047973 [Glycine max]
MPAASVGKCDAMSIGSWLYISLSTLLNGMGVGAGCAKYKEVVVNGLSEDQAWSACQTAAGRALWKHAIHDPLADVLAGETYLRNLHEKIKKDIVNNARETSGVIVAV